MKNICEIMGQAKTLQHEIEKLLRDSTYNEYSDLSGLDIDYGDSEQLFQLEELRNIVEKLADVEEALRYMSLPVQAGGKLHKNAVGRYETDDGHVLCAGRVVDVLISDGIFNAPYWSRDRIEHDGGDYCLVKNLNTPLAGLTVRIRGEV